MVSSNPEPKGAASPRFRRPELLAPAGDWSCAKAAIENGADAIYFGLERFNARMRAHNFTEADLPELMRFLHGRGVRGYVTLNTLIFQDELPEAESCIRTLAAHGVDAVIVQDIGLCRLIRSIAPDLPMHASTQMTITSAAGVEFARELGCELVVLARECSLAEVNKIQQTLNESEMREFPLEMFVHGALCVAYSGQCLTSEALGGRSANRGECAQACRMPYELISDGAAVPLGDRRYLLSPQDLAGLEILPQLMEAGVASLKIEGRLKSPEYVANITRIYRQALDLAAEKASGPSQKPPDEELRRHAQASRHDLEMSFSRGLHTGWFNGIDNQKLVHARFGKKRGVFIGTVQKVEEDDVVITEDYPLKAGDGVVFDAGRPDLDEEGGRVFTRVERKGVVLLRFRRGAVDFQRVRPGDKVWKTDDPELNRKLRQTYAPDTPQYQRPLRMEVHGVAGRPLTLIAKDELGNVARADSSHPLQTANKRPLTPLVLKEQLGRLGNTPFRLASLDTHLEGELNLPVSELNRLRRCVVGQLNHERALPKPWTIQLASEAQRPDVAKAPNDVSQPFLIVTARSLEQLRSALDTGVTTVYSDFENPKHYREAVSEFRKSAAGLHGAEIFLAPPRIFKPGEEWILKHVESAEADGFLVRNYDHLRRFPASRRRGDFSLNVANALTADYFLTIDGLESVTASYDLNNAQLEALLRAAEPSRVEVTLHQRMPMFHMEHCVFCAFLSTGKDYRDCGRPCDQHSVHLRDRAGANHPLKADAGCRNTVFNGRAQSGAEYAHGLSKLGVRRFRVEFVNEDRGETERAIKMYQRLLRGEVSGAELWKELKLINRLGVTRGQMDG